MKKKTKNNKTKPQALRLESMDWVIYYSCLEGDCRTLTPPQQERIVQLYKRTFLEFQDKHQKRRSLSTLLFIVLAICLGIMLWILYV